MTKYICSLDRWIAFSHLTLPPSLLMAMQSLSVIVTSPSNLVGNKDRREKTHEKQERTPKQHRRWFRSHRGKTPNHVRMPTGEGPERRDSSKKPRLLRHDELSRSHAHWSSYYTRSAWCWALQLFRSGRCARRRPTPIWWRHW